MFTCRTCDISFQDCKNYISHVKLSHFASHSFECGDILCLRIFKSISSMRSHIEKTHNKRNIEPPKKNKNVIQEQKQPR